MTKESRIYSEERIVSLKNGIGQTRQPHVKEQTWVPILHHTRKSVDWRLNWTPEMEKVL